MSIPKIDVPTFELTLPSNNKKIKMRVLLAKEEKILLMAREGEDESEATLAIKQILNNCILDKTVDVEELPSFDIEYIFLKLRSKSISSIAELQFSGRENTSCNQCKKPRVVKINLDDIQIVTDPKHTKKIELGNGVGIMMKYPSISIIDKKKMGEDLSSIFELITSCIDSIYDSETVYETSNMEKGELQEFIEGLPQKEFNKIKDFFDTMPKLSYTVKFNCDVCGFNQEYVLEGLNDFF
jgi:hypothetical protein